MVKSIFYEFSGFFLKDLLDFGGGGGLAGLAYLGEGFFDEFFVGGVYVDLFVGYVDFEFFGVVGGECDFS